MTNSTIIDIKNLHCKFFENFISKEWSELNKSSQGLEIIRWRTLYWLAFWEKEIDNCHDCKMRFYDIKEGFRNAGVKLHFEPEVIFK